ncbi:MAG TPA: glycosyltransferase family 1 protein [Acidimicrobiales bacterium]|nr:glycosyltransferase family 1 protein [Acidimicrobiales bacterium]
MKVLLVVEQLRRRVPGGVGTYARGLVQGLVAMGGTDPDVALFASRPAPGGSATDPLAGLGLPLLTSPLPSAALVRLWNRGLGRVPAGRDLIHATSLAFPPRMGGRLSVMVHDLAWREVPDAFPPHGRRWHEEALGRAMRRADLLLTPSPGVAEALSAEGRVPVEVVDEGCDHLPPPDVEGAARVLAGAGVDGPYILSVGTLEPRKNLPRLVEAYGLARPALPGPWPLIVVGPRGWGGPLEAAEGVVPVGPVPASVLAGLYAGARLLAYVPLLEGWGLPATEAMHAGVPVVASPMPSTGGAALEVDPNDPGSIAHGLVVAAGDDDRRRALVAAGATRAAGLRWESVARRHTELWEKLCR